MQRRDFLTSLSAAGLASALPTSLSAQTAASPSAPPTTTAAPGITVDTLAAAEQLAGLSFNPEQRAAALKDVTGRVAGYEALHALSLPNSTVPALMFDPRLLGASVPAAPATSSNTPWAPTPCDLPPDEEDLAFLSIGQLAHLLRTRQVTARRLTELALSRLQHYDSVLQAVVTLLPERARAQADRADLELSAGKWRGPLHGIPWGAKDLLAVAGAPTTWGAAPFKNQQFDTDAEVVRRLDAAGAILVAKLTLGALAWGDLWFGGKTKCPWNLDLGSSGSSAGPAAAVSAGLLPFTIGSETLGSILSPSTRNGVSGLRPTYGRVSRAGAMALSWSMDKLGPLARSAADCSLVFAAIHGADPGDPTAVTAPFRLPDAPPAPTLPGVRLGYLPAAFESSGDARALHETALDTLRSLGAELVPITYPTAPLGALRAILSVEAAAAFDELTRSGAINALTPAEVHPWGDSLRAARYIPAVEFVQANRVRTQLLRDLEAMLERERIDVWVVPSTHSDTLVMTNLTGHPAVCVPDGFLPVKGASPLSPRRQPVTLAFHARLYRDDLAVSVAQAFQQATDWHRLRPPIA